MGKTSSEVKRRYNNKAYDYIQIFVSKGDKETIKAQAAQNGESLNGYLNRLIAEDMRRDKK